MHKTNEALARSIIDHVRDEQIGYEALVTAVVANLDREQLWSLENNCAALGFEADRVFANCEHALTEAHAARALTDV